MSISLRKQSHKPDRMNFIGGSDARVIMGKDDKALCACGRKNAVKSPVSISQAS